MAAMEEQERRERIDLAQAFAFHLLKGIKQIGLYRHSEARYGEFLSRAHQAIAGYHDRFGSLSLRVEPQNFLVQGEPLFAEDDALPYRFYREGIRQLVFRPGLPIEELVAFTQVALSDADRTGEDVLAQLWRMALDHIEYVVVDGFKMDEFSEDEVEVEVDRIVGYLYNRLKTSSDDFLRFARISAEDLDGRVDEVDQIRGLVINSTTASDELKARVQREIEREENERLFPKLVTAVFQVVESGVDDAGALEEMFIQLLDAMLMQEDFATINSIVLKLRAMEQRDENNSAISRIKMGFLSRMGEEQRLGRIGEILRTTRPRHPSDLVRYLQHIEGLATPVLLDVLQTVEIPENRTLLCDVLAEYAREMPEPFVNRMGSDKPQTVRDMVYILEKSGHPDRIKMFAQVLKHPNLAVRLDAMHVIARGQTAEAQRLITECLTDSTPQIRMLAARLLPEFDREKAFLELARLVRDSGFDRRSPEEKTAFYAGLGATGLPGALSLLQSILTTQPGLLNKKKVTEDKLNAVAGLGASESIYGLKLLQTLVEDKTQPTEVLVAARKAIYQTRKAVFGEYAAES